MNRCFNYPLLLTILLLSTFLCCCNPSNEDIAFKGVELIVTGAKSVNVENDGRKISVDIGQAGGTLRFEATGKNAGNGFISSIRSAGMDDYYRRTADSDKNVFPYVFYENEELKVSVLSDNPHITQVEVKENSVSSKKTHELVFGAVSTITDVSIFQAGK